MNKFDIKELRKRTGMTQGQLAEMVGVHVRTVQVWESGGAIPETKHAILRRLMGGELSAPCAVASSGGAAHSIRYYPNVSASMGGTEFLENPNEDSLEMSVPGFRDCQFAINAYGDSMLPLLHSGDIVVVSEWTENFIEWGEVYLVITRTGNRCIKRLMPSEKDGCVECHSDNTQGHPPFSVEKADILKLFRVKGCIQRFNM